MAECEACEGTGEGMTPDSVCDICHGTGTVKQPKQEPEYEAD